MNWTIAVSWAYLPVCMALGLAYAGVLYGRGAGPRMSPLMRWLLAAIRALLVFLIAFMLLEPMLRTLRFATHPPRLMVVVDNSGSMEAPAEKAALMSGVKQDMSSLQGSYDLRLLAMDGDLRSASEDSFSFDGVRSNYALPLQRLSAFGERSYDAILWYGDGIHNVGPDPVSLAQKSPIPVFFVGLGDSSISTDLAVTGVRANQTVLTGGRAPLEVDLNAVGCRTQQARLSVRVNGEPRYRQDLPINRDPWYQELRLDIVIDRLGANRVVVELEALEGEKNPLNNRYELVVQGVEKRKRIELWSRTVHPDIGTWRSLLEGSAAYDISLHRNGFAAGDQDAVLLFDWFRNEGDLALFEQLKAKNIPVVMQLGPEVDAARFNKATVSLGLERSGPGDNAVQALLNPNFDLFDPGEGLGSAMGGWPPLRTLFGSLQRYRPLEVLAYQQLGAVRTDDPLALLRSEQNYRYAVLAGTGIWAWRLTDHREHGSHDLLSGLLGQVLQYVVDRDEERRLRLNAVRPVIYPGESQTVRAVVLDHNGQLVKDLAPMLRIRDPEGGELERAMDFSSRAYETELKGLALPGEYRLDLEIVQGGELLRATAGFQLSPQDLERLSDRADFSAMRSVAAASGGYFGHWDKRDELLDRLRTDPRLKATIKQEKNWFSLLQMKWVFWLLLGLLSIEWAIRKYIGGY